jgi:predicted ester cyclase
MQAHKLMVEKFYRQLWDEQSKQAIPSVLEENFSFRGSLGQEKRGHNGFSEYVDRVHLALGEYKCHIEQLVAEGDKVFAKMRFTGIHQNEFLGFKATNKRVSWAGCALFSFKNQLICDVWVLGDLKALEAQLEENKLQENS